MAIFFMAPMTAFLSSAVLFIAPFVFLTLSMVLLAASGASLGIRKFYVKNLLKIFEFGRGLTSVNNLEDESDAEDDLLELDNANEPDCKVGHEDGELHIVEYKKEKVEADKLLATNAQGKPRMSRSMTVCEDSVVFKLSDVLYYCKSGVHAMIHDDITNRFTAAQLPAWNLLTREGIPADFLNWKIALLFCAGFAVRYFILLPFRVFMFVIGLSWMGASTITLGFFRDCWLRQYLLLKFNLAAYRILGRTLGADVTYHNIENKPQPGGICVANHTSPIDALIMSADTTFSLIAQRYTSGVLAYCQQVLGDTLDHIWFERNEAEDRAAVATKLENHINAGNKPPILIFPEGTCINNTSVMQFKKGCFEVPNVTIYPVAIKYNPIFADPFWNSSKHSMAEHILQIMTSWAIVCDIWYLPPTKMQPNENAITFANRVKASIAKAGGLVDMDWDGQLKRQQPKPQFRQREMEEFSQVLLRRRRRIDEGNPKLPEHFIVDAERSDITPPQSPERQNTSEC